MKKSNSTFVNASLACSMIATGLLIAFPRISNIFQIMRVKPSIFAFPVIQPVYFIIPLAVFLLGFIFGHIAGKHTGVDKKTDLSIVIGRAGTGVVIMAMIISFFLRPLAGANAMARREVCRNNIAALVQMLHMYADENYGCFPPSFKALDEAGHETWNLIRCPTDERDSDYGGYGFNTAATMDCPPDMPLVGDFDSSNHSDIGGNIGYVDGRTRWYDGEYSAGSGPLKDVSPEDWVRK